MFAHPKAFARHVARHRLLLTGVALLCGGVGCSRTEAPRPTSAPQGAGLPEMRGVVFVLFDSQTQQRFARLQIGCVSMEYRRQGFLRVAWHPLVVLNEVTLETEAGAAWPTQGSQVLRALQTLGRREDMILRQVRLQLGGSPPTSLQAGTARLRPDGALVLTDIAAREGAPGAPPPNPRAPLIFWLVGPNAGQLTSPGGNNAPLAIASSTAPDANSPLP